MVLNCIKCNDTVQNVYDCKTDTIHYLCKCQCDLDEDFVPELWDSEPDNDKIKFTDS